MALRLLDGKRLAMMISSDAKSMHCVAHTLSVKVRSPDVDVVVNYDADSSKRHGLTRHLSCQVFKNRGLRLKVGRLGALHRPDFPDLGARRNFGIDGVNRCLNVLEDSSLRRPVYLDDHLDGEMGNDYVS